MHCHAAVEMNRTTRTALHWSHTVTAATIRGQDLFSSDLLIVRLLFKGGVYSRAESLRRNTVDQK